MSEKLIKEFKTPISGKSVFIGPDAGCDQLIFALESSCDETACAIVKNGREVIANTVNTQIKTHELYGGVVPEVAAREHLNAIVPVIEKTFADSKIKQSFLSHNVSSTPFVALQLYAVEKSVPH